MRAAIVDVDVYLPEQVLDNAELSRQFVGWTAEKIFDKTGIRQRRISRPDECASDLAVAAAKGLFEKGSCRPADIDFLLFCTQSPDYFLPTTACIVQDRLGLPTSCGALDFNLGCSGYIYGLSLAKGLIETGQAREILLLTSETYSKFIHPGDKSVRTLFGDAAAATLVRAVPFSEEFIGPFVFGTDGSGARNLIVPSGGLRQATVNDAEIISDESGNRRTVNNLYMNGPEIFNFTIQSVPRSVMAVLEKSGKQIDEIDHFIFHQANRFMLDHLRKKLKIPEQKFCIDLEKYGNTVSSTIPIALHDELISRTIKQGDLLMLVGFGVGYSWGAVLVRWHGET